MMTIIEWSVLRLLFCMVAIFAARFAYCGADAAAEGGGGVMERPRRVFVDGFEGPIVRELELVHRSA